MRSALRFISNALWALFIAVAFLGPAVQTHALGQGLSVRVYKFDSWPPQAVDSETVCEGSITQVEQIDFDWGGDVVAGCDYDQVLVHFSGVISIPEKVLLVVQHDDGAALLLNGFYWIDAWYDTGCGWDNVWVEPGTYTIDFWFYENGGGACAKLWYSDENQYEYLPVPSEWFSETLPATSTTTEPETTTEPVTTTEPETTTTWEPTTTFTEPTTTATSIVPITTVPVMEVPTSLPQEVFTTTTLTEMLITEPLNIPTTTEAVLPATTTPLVTFPASTVEVPDSAPVPLTTSLPNTQPENTEAPPITLPAEPDAAQLAEFVTNLDASDLAQLTDEQVTELISDIANADLTPEQAAAIAEVLSTAPDEVKQQFQETVDIFSGAFDNYIPLGSNVTVTERRIIVAVTATVALPLSPVAPGSRAASRRRRG